jgi:alpha-L-fucosidase 2
MTNSSIVDSLFLSYYFTSIPGNPIPQVTCFDNSTLKVRGAAGNPGMQYEILARVQSSPAGFVTCNSTANGNSTVTVTHAEAAWITWVGGTEFDLNAGDSAHDYSYKGADPHDSLVSLLQNATTSTYSSLLGGHTSDYQSGMGKFSLSLGQKPDLSHSTDQLVASYQTGIGNPYVEWLLFNYGRYMLFSSARGALPANLQGKWGRDSAQPWSAGKQHDCLVGMC